MRMRTGLVTFGVLGATLVLALSGGTRAQEGITNTDTPPPVVRLLSKSEFQTRIEEIRARRYRAISIYAVFATHSVYRSDGIMRIDPSTPASDRYCRLTSPASLDRAIRAISQLRWKRPKYISGDALMGLILEGEDGSVRRVFFSRGAQATVPVLFDDGVASISASSAGRLADALERSCPKLRHPFD